MLSCFVSNLTPVMPARTEKVSVVTRTRNRPLLLERAMKSVLGQSFSDWAHFIINDGGNPEFVDHLALKYRHQYRGRLRVLHNPVSFGMEAASNAAICRTRGAYVAIHDDDDSWATEFLTETVQCLDSHSANPQIGGVVTHCKVIHEEIRNNSVIKLSEGLFREKQHAITYFEMLAENCFPPICFLFRRSALESVGLFDSSIFVLGDWDFNLRLMRHADILVIPSTLANYHHRPKADGPEQLSNSVYADNENHRATRRRLLDRAIRGDLDAGAQSLSSVLLFAEVMRKLEQMESKLDDSIRKISNDLAFEFRSHVDWLAGKYDQKEK